MPASLPPVEGAAAGRSATDDYQELVDSLDDVVFRFDGDGRWTFLSSAWAKRLGWDAAACLGRAAVKYVHPLDRALVFQNWAEVLSGRAHAYRGDVRFLEAGGGFRWMLVSARGLRDAQGALRGVTGTLTDVSAAKAVEAELIAAHAAAEAANRSKSEFLSTMSHELRTPLNAVIGLTESLLEVGPPFDPDRTTRYLGIIHASGRQLLAQINDILDLARLEAGKTRPNPAAFDLGSMCRSSAEAVRRAAEAKSLAVEVRRTPGPVIVQADERLIRQVLQNLLSNAVKFTPAQGRVTVEVEGRSGGGARFTVRDTGIGIAPEKLHLLFKVFSQVDGSLARQYGGTGIGVALVDRIVRLHGGTVTVESAPGAGSTFTIDLPPAGAAPATNSSP